MTGKKKDQCNINPERQWGGKREGGGFPAKWRHGNSKPIRIPEALHEAVLAYAHALDEGRRPGGESVAESEPPAQPTQPAEALTAEEIKALMLTLEAINRTLERWRQELKKHDAKLARWEKAHQLFNQLEADLKRLPQSG